MTGMATNSPPCELTSVLPACTMQLSAGSEVKHVAVIPIDKKGRRHKCMLRGHTTCGMHEYDAAMHVTLAQRADWKLHRCRYEHVRPQAQHGTQNSYSFCTYVAHFCRRPAFVRIYFGDHAGVMVQQAWAAVRLAPRLISESVTSDLSGSPIKTGITSVRPSCRSQQTRCLSSIANCLHMRDAGGFTSSANKTNGCIHIISNSVSDALAGMHG